MRMHPKAQRGGALLVAMIMIFMISIMGVSVMQSSTLERQMTTNAIQARETFQAAESTTEEALNDPNNLSASFVAGANSSVTVSLDLKAHSAGRSGARDMTTEATLSYIGSGVVEGSSIGVFQGLRFDAEGLARFNDGSSSATIAQGAIRRVPGNL